MKTLIYAAPAVKGLKAWSTLLITFIFEENKLGKNNLFLVDLNATHNN